MAHGQHPYFPHTVEMRERLGRACRRGRQRAGIHLIDVAHAADLSETTLSRFERGTRWIRETDHVVATYARLLSIEPADLWRAALEEDA